MTNHERLMLRRHLYASARHYEASRDVLVELYPDCVDSVIVAMIARYDSLAAEARGFADQLGPRKGS